MSVVPRSRNQSQTRFTSFSGADAPEVMPTVVAPSVHENSAARGLRTIDATCPLVTKVHTQARRYAAEGYIVVLIGHAGHEEVVGTMGEAPERIVLVETPEEV